MLSRCRKTGLIVLLLSATALAGCKPENQFVAPPPAEVSVAPPVQQNVQPFVELPPKVLMLDTSMRFCGK